MKTIKKNIGLSLLMIFFMACPKQDNPDMYYSIINNSSEKIHLFQNNIDSIMTPEYLSQRPLEFINSQDTLKSAYYTILFNNNRKLNILIYKESTLVNYSWQEIQMQNIFDKRYILTLEELRAMNFTIVYDGR